MQSPREQTPEITTNLQKSCIHHLFPSLLYSDYICPFGHTSAKKGEIICLQMNDKELDDRELDEHMAAIIESKEKTIILGLNLEGLEIESEYSLYASLLKIHKKVQTSLARVQEGSIQMDAEAVDIFYSDCLENSRINPNLTTEWGTGQDKDELFIIYCGPYFNTHDPRYNHIPAIHRHKL